MECELRFRDRTRRWGLAWLTVLVVNAFAQTPTADLTELSLAELADIPVVSASRRSQNRLQSPRAMAVITGEEIRRRNFRTVPEALIGLSGVFLQQTNYAGGSPILRGMVGNRILVLVNGVRMNNGIYRLGPNQYLSWIDIATVERIEVLRGAGGVLYGSDAFGGVINVITRQARIAPKDEKMSASVRTRFSSADRSGGGRLGFAASQSDWAIAGGYSQEGFGDLRSGGSDRAPSHTGYRQEAGDLSVYRALPGNRTISASLSRLKQFDVPRTDVLTAGTELQSNWNPQGRDVATVQYSRALNRRWIDSVDLTFALQHPFEDYYRVLPSVRNNQQQSTDSVVSTFASLQASSHLGKKHLLTYGFETGVDRISSARRDLNRLTGIRTSVASAYPDGARYMSTSLFAQDEAQFSERWSVVAGIRQDWIGLRANVANAAAGKLQVALDPASLNGSLFSLFRLAGGFTAVAGVSQGFRSPNIDDTGMFGPSGSRFEVPNVALKPERSVNAEYGFRFEHGGTRASLSVFQDRYRELIDRAPGSFQDRNFFDSNGNGIRDSGELAIWQRQNIGRAYVQGFEGESLVVISESWTWSSNASWTKGDNRIDGSPLTRIPPLYGTSRLTWQSSRGWWIEIAAQAAKPQHRLAWGDLTDLRIGPGGTPGFAAGHLRAGVQRGRFAGLAVALENIFDKRYKFHGSGVYRPGINLAAGYTRNF